MEIIEVKVNDLIPYEFNNKEHDEMQVNRIANSIKEFWFTQPIVVDKDNTVIIWHWRLLASKKLWLESVPVVKLENLTPTQVKKLRIIDNKLNESEWNMENLKIELDDLEDLNIWDLEIWIEDLFPFYSSDEDNWDNNYWFDEWKFENKEYWVDDLWWFEHKCPKCGFEFNSSDEEK